MISEKMLTIWITINMLLTIIVGLRNFAIRVLASDNDPETAIEESDKVIDFYSFKFYQHRLTISW